MSTGGATKRLLKPSSVRQRVNRRILQLSIVGGLAASALAAFVYLASAYPAIRRAQEINAHTFSEIKCSGPTCDTTILTTDWQLEGSSYVIDAQTRYFVSVLTPTEEIPWRLPALEFSEPAFIARFRNPASYKAPNGETWRLYSRSAMLEGRKFEIIVGYAEKVPWKMVELPQSVMGTVDDELEKEANKLAEALITEGQELRWSSKRVLADGFEVVDASSERVSQWGPWLPMFFPNDKELPAAGHSLHIDAGELCLIQTDTDGRLLATSVVPIGNLWLLAVLAVLALLAGGFITRALSRRFLRNYFALSGATPPTIREALRDGEGQRAEFKRGLSLHELRVGGVEEEILKSIAAFANTNDGAIFIGIDNSGHVKGLNLDFNQRDQLERKLLQMVRNSIKPTPPLQITFDDVEGLTVAKITVGRGTAPVYMINGVIYVRYGSSDVQAQPEDLRRLVMEYAA